MKENRILRFIGFMLVLFCMLIFSVSAFNTEQSSNPVTIELNQGILGNIIEGQTLHYTPNNTSSLDDILQITTTQTNVHLFFDTDLNAQSGNYAIYKIVVKVGDTIPVGSEFSKGYIISTLTLGVPDNASGVALDAAGAWTFDFGITTTTKSVSSNQTSTVRIKVSAESTST